MKRDRRPIHKRVFLYTFKELEAVTGIPHTTLRYYKKLYFGWPGFPTTREAVVAFLQRNGLPKLSAPKPRMRAKVVHLIEVERLSFAEAGRQLGISRQAVHMCYKRHLIQKLRVIGKEQFYGRIRLQDNEPEE